MSFTDLGVPARLAAVLSDAGITTPTPIQSATLPDALDGRDVLGRGRTGSGKTLAFLLPVVARLTGGPRAKAGSPRALILAPTRELAGQIDAALRPLAATARLTSHLVIGGVSQGAQVSALNRGVDILVACPGRLEDLIAQRRCSLGSVEITVLDEADHMADLGFLPAVRRLLGATPARGQRLLFSATLDRAVDSLVRQYLPAATVHEADSARSPISTMAHHVLRVERDQRLAVLLDLTAAPGRTVIFTRTKHGAKALTKQLARGGVPAVELHGNLSQNARTRNLAEFHAGTVATLVATDIAARGIHVDDVALVIHADPPADPKAYVHRSGRTARAGNAGTVVTLMTGDQRREVEGLTRAAGITPTVTRVSSIDDPVLTTLAPGARTHVEPSTIPAPQADAPARPRHSASGSPRGRGGNRSHNAGGRGQNAAAAPARPRRRRGPRTGPSTVTSSSHSASAYSAKRH